MAISSIHLLHRSSMLPPAAADADRYPPAARVRCSERCRVRRSNARLVDALQRRDAGCRGAAAAAALSLLGRRAAARWWPAPAIARPSRASNARASDERRPRGLMGEWNIARVCAVVVSTDCMQTDGEQLLAARVRLCADIAPHVVFGGG
jgi:hypothetical protein